jgi:hypothetical protein
VLEGLAISDDVVSSIDLGINTLHVMLTEALPGDALIPYDSEQGHDDGCIPSDIDEDRDTER